MHRLYRKLRIYVVKWRWFLQALRQNDVFLCKLDVNIKNRTAVAGSVDLFKPESKKCYFIASSSLKIKCGKSKGMQEKVSIIGVWCGEKNLSLGITVRHHSASLVMPNSDPHDRFFYPNHTRLLSDAEQWSRVTDFSLHTTHPCKILIVLYAVQCSDNPQ